MAKVIAGAGRRAEVRTAYEFPDLVATLEGIRQDAVVVIEALWVASENIEKLLVRFPDMHFVVRCHSQVGFLQVEPKAITLLRQQIELAEVTHRFHVAANSQRCAEALTKAYSGHVRHLPNLYWHERVARRHRRDGSAGPLRVGSFGALRIQKNHCTGAVAAILLAHRLGRDLEFYMNSGREEGGGRSVRDALHSFLAGVPGAKIVEVPWSTWPAFRRVLSGLDLCFHLSATETFSLVTADAIAEGVPCVVGPAIDWVPPSWIAPIDHPEAAARVAIGLLGDPYAAEHGTAALEHHVRRGLEIWQDYLGSLEVF